MPGENAQRGWVKLNKLSSGLISGPFLHLREKQSELCKVTCKPLDLYCAIRALGIPKITPTESKCTQLNYTSGSGTTFDFGCVMPLASS